ncbi:MAG: cupredoxin domain-containing protein [Candidatus Acidiferrales bacterium]
MRFHSSVPLLIALFVSLIPAAMAQDSRLPKPFDQPAHIIQMNAADYQFAPSTIHIKVGQNIRLRVTATDKTHAIRINPFPNGASVSTPPGLEFAAGEDCWKLKKNLTQTIEFVAHEPGTYTFSCCKSCGSGHKRMKGQIIVEP